MALTEDMRSMFNTIAFLYGMDPAALLTIADVETGGIFNADASNKFHVGLFQFDQPTWDKYGKGRDPKDAYDNTDAAVRLLLENGSNFAKANGRWPTLFEVYLLHQQGPGGAPALLKADPNAKAWEVLSTVGEYRNNPQKAKDAVSGNISKDLLNLYGSVENVPVSALLGYVQNEVQQKAEKYGADANDPSYRGLENLGFSGTDAVKKYQASHGIQQTGVIGPQTVAAIQSDFWSKYLPTEAKPSLDPNIRSDFGISGPYSGENPTPQLWSVLPPKFDSLGSGAWFHPFDASGGSTAPQTPPPPQTPVPPAGKRSSLDQTLTTPVSYRPGSLSSRPDLTPPGKVGHGLHAVLAPLVEQMIPEGGRIGMQNAVYRPGTSMPDAGPGDPVDMTDPMAGRVKDPLDHAMTDPFAKFSRQMSGGDPTSRLRNVRNQQQLFGAPPNPSSGGDAKLYSADARGDGSIYDPMGVGAGPLSAAGYGGTNAGYLGAGATPWGSGAEDEKAKMDARLADILRRFGLGQFTEV